MRFHRCVETHPIAIDTQKVCRHVDAYIHGVLISYLYRRLCTHGNESNVFLLRIFVNDFYGIRYGGIVERGIEELMKKKKTSRCRFVKLGKFKILVLWFDMDQ